jgi:hypothetical protein
VGDPRFGWVHFCDRGGEFIPIRMVGNDQRQLDPALAGALAGTLAGMIAVSILPAADEAGGFLTGLGFQGWGWMTPLILPPLAGIVAYFATRAAAIRKLKELT